MRILIVEDEFVVGMSLHALVRKLGHEVIGPIGRLSQALDSVIRQAPDAALLDVNLHGEMVYPVAHALTQRSVPFVFVTGYDPRQIRADYRHRTVLQKPFNREGLQRALDDLSRLVQRPGDVADWPPLSRP